MAGASNFRRVHCIKISCYVREVYGDGATKSYQLNDIFLYNDRRPFHLDDVEVRQRPHGTSPAVIGGREMGEPGSRALILRAQLKKERRSGTRNERRGKKGGARGKKKTEKERTEEKEKRTRKRRERGGKRRKGEEATRFNT